MRQRTKRLLAQMLALVMMVAIMPTMAMAEEYDYEKQKEITSKFEYITQAASENYLNANGYYDQVVYMGGIEEDPDTRYLCWSVHYLANYDYEGSGDEIEYRVLYLGPWGTSTQKMLTPAECGFTADGYVANADAAWEFTEDYQYVLDDPYAASNGMLGVWPAADGTKDALTFRETDGGYACYVQANWTQKGDPIKVKPEKPVVEKQVNGGDSTTAGIGDTLNFTLTSAVPTDLWKCFSFVDEPVIQTTYTNSGTTINGAKYVLTFHDRADSALTLNTSSIKVKVGLEGHEFTAENFGNYITVTTETGDDCAFHVTVDLVKLYEDGHLHDQDYADPPANIVVSYTGELNDTATGGIHKNFSKVSWVKKIVDRPDPTDPVDPEDPDTPPDGPDDPEESEEDEVDVETYRIWLAKFDADSSPNNRTYLNGARFQLQKLNGDGAWENVGGEKETVRYNGFNGNAIWDGLGEGTYRLFETKAPDGYLQDNTPREFKIPEDATRSQIVDVDFPNGKVPSTGGEGTAMYTVAGLALLCSAAGVYVLSRKKRAEG